MHLIHQPCSGAGSSLLWPVQPCWSVNGTGQHNANVVKDKKTEDKSLLTLLSLRSHWRLVLCSSSTINLNFSCTQLKSSWRKAAQPEPLSEPDPRHLLAGAVAMHSSLPSNMLNGNNQAQHTQSESPGMQCPGMYSPGMYSPGMQCQHSVVPHKHVVGNTSGVA